MIVSHAFTWLHINLKKKTTNVDFGHGARLSFKLFTTTCIFSTPNMNRVHQKPVHAWEKYQFKVYHYDTCTHDVYIDQWPCVYTCDSHMHVHINANWRKLVAAMQYVDAEIYYCCSMSLAVWLLGVSSVCCFVSCRVQPIIISHWFAISFLSLYGQV